ncbi:T9SS type A sorting domain-containing protein [bacterium]|nr:T9SS type A sorting domain-containing protein [bacterium]
MKTYFTLIALFLYHFCEAQILNFSNQALEQYLLNEKAVDITGNGFGDSAIDVNNDGKIQLEEALNVTSLVIYPSETYKISEVYELHQFSNLDSLKIGGGGFKLEDVSNLALDSLSYIRVTDISDMDKVDLSDLPALESIYLEGLTHLKYLNLKNGSMAKYFSLFYTDITFACVDSIAMEYEVVEDHLSPEGRISLDCTLGITEEETIDFKVYPNPVTEQLFIECDVNNFIVILRDMQGRVLIEANNKKRLDLSDLNSGLYQVSIHSGNLRSVKLINIQ